MALVLVDAVMWLAGLTLATWSRWDFDAARVDWGRLLVGAGIAIGMSTVCGLATRLYLRGRRLGSFEESLILAGCSLVATAGLTLVVAVQPGRHLVPLSAVLAGGAFQLIGALAFRYAWRVAHHARPRRRSHAHRVVVFGAGDAGSAITKALLRDAHSDLLPVAILDDDPDKAYLRLHGIPVVGGRDDIATAAAEHDADTLLIAIPSATRDEMVAVAGLAHEAGLYVKILPSASDWVVDRPADTGQIRQFTVADYLGRDEVRTDIEQVAAVVTGRRVLVTGAGGFIGAALAETLARFGPRRLVLADHDENALHAMSLRLSGLGRNVVFEPLLVDIRDREAIWRQVTEQTPDVIFHAAAHKHVDMLERFPSEGLKTNVRGTLNVLEAAAAAGVERFVNISTDKAADPVGVLGATKRIAEMITAHYATVLGAAFMSVRFGNVLGSTGSVMHTFRHQIEANMPLTVTHPEVARYFMTCDEAVRLVVQAAALGRGGDALVLDMGEPVQIVDLARRLAAELRPGWEPEIVFVGLRPGERLLDEPEAASDELLDRPHEKIRRFKVPALDPVELKDLDDRLAVDVLTRRLLHLARGSAYDPSDVTT